MSQNINLPQGIEVVRIVEDNPSYGNTSNKLYVYRENKIILDLDLGEFLAYHKHKEYDDENPFVIYYIGKRRFLISLLIEDNIKFLCILDLNILDSSVYSNILNSNKYPYLIPLKLDFDLTTDYYLYASGERFIISGYNENNIIEYELIINDDNTCIVKSTPYYETIPTINTYAIYENTDKFIARYYNNADYVINDQYILSFDNKKTLTIYDRINETKQTLEINSNDHTLLSRLPTFNIYIRIGVGPRYIIFNSDGIEVVEYKCEMSETNKATGNDDRFLIDDYGFIYYNNGYYSYHSFKDNKSYKLFDNNGYSVIAMCSDLAHEKFRENIRDYFIDLNKYMITIILSYL